MRYTQTMVIDAICTNFRAGRVNFLITDRETSTHRHFYSRVMSDMHIRRGPIAHIPSHWIEYTLEKPTTPFSNGRKEPLKDTACSSKGRGCSQIVSYEEYLARNGRTITPEQFERISEYQPTHHDLETAHNLLSLELKVIGSTETQKTIIAKIIGGLGGYRGACEALEISHSFLLLREANLLDPALRC